MNDDTQTTLDGGEVETDATNEVDGPETDDFGDELGEHETYGGYNRYNVSSLLQKAVRRSDEERAAWGAWELTRSGYAWNLWDRLALYVVEDLRADDDIVLLSHGRKGRRTPADERFSWTSRIEAGLSVSDSSQLFTPRVRTSSSRHTRIVAVRILPTNSSTETA